MPVCLLPGRLFGGCVLCCGGRVVCTLCVLVAVPALLVLFVSVVAGFAPLTAACGSCVVAL